MGPKVKPISRKLTPEQMIEMRRGGRTLREIAKAAGVCSTQVLRLTNDNAPDEKWPERKREPVKPKVAVGAKLDSAIKDALKGYCDATGVSISAFIEDAVAKELRTCGIEIKREPVNRGEPLPFEVNQ